MRSARTNSCITSHELSCAKRSCYKICVSTEQKCWWRTWTNICRKETLKQLKYGTVLISAEVPYAGTQAYDLRFTIYCGAHRIAYE